MAGVGLGDFKAGFGESRWWVCGICGVLEVFVEHRCREKLMFSLLFCEGGAWPQLAAQGAGSLSLLCSKERGCGIGYEVGVCIQPQQQGTASGLIPHVCCCLWYTGSCSSSPTIELSCG